MAQAHYHDDESYDMQPVFCERCGFTLRATPGLHRASEPYLETDGQGRYIRCPACGHANRNLTPLRIAERSEEPRRT